MQKNTFIFVGLTLLLVVVALLDLCCGSAYWILPDSLFALFSEDLSSIADSPSPIANILIHIRLPKMLTAILAGASLSVAGLMMQTLFRNPLAGPYILGVSSGASLGVALLTMCGVAISSSGLISGSAIIGCLITMLLVMLIAKRIRSNITLLIVGMMVGNIAGALVNMIQNFANPDSLKLFIVWTLGSLNSVSWDELPTLIIGIAIAAILVLMLIKPLNGLLLGEDYARGLGINVERTRWMLVLASCLLAGSVTAFCGPIAFIGVAVPHIARGILTTSNHRLTIPASALIGANILLICDILCNLSTYALPISTMSALFGAPIILWIVLKK
ncbi:MAG: iron ABC transporter permease [Paludibacteraceae bacterium]|nr:iron ABC transporter permease [Paludibacteraceae bacterium]